VVTPAAAAAPTSSRGGQPLDVLISIERRRRQIDPEGGLLWHEAMGAGDESARYGSIIVAPSRRAPRWSHAASAVDSQTSGGAAGKQIHLPRGLHVGSRPLDPIDRARRRNNGHAGGRGRYGSPPVSQGAFEHDAPRQSQGARLSPTPTE
jgi:hypothetical protein